MSLALYTIPCVAVLLEGVLLWRLTRRELRFRYSCLTIFVAYRLLGDLILFPVNRFKPGWFAATYWRIETIALFMQLLLNWEFYRKLFGDSNLRDLAWKVLLATELVLLPAVLALGWNQATSVRYPFLHLSPVVEQYFSLAQCLILLATAAVAWYYRLPLGRNLRGLGFGFGAYLLLRVVDFASLQAFRGFGGYWRALTPMTFVGMVGLWLWAFWHYAPPPRHECIDEAPYLQWKLEWMHLWVRLRKLLRGGTG